ncbi:MAG: Pyruvate-flavodoxin oxidoreductase [Syntrophus sp. PtaB.Bin001]|nr:MAG: Pyruvate-flavodoxin oxidoreductase [Syntrophus sp. PtaB.Bin001]
MEKKAVAIDGNEAAASVAFRLNEVVAIYPITPSSPMAELCDAWAAAGRKNIWGDAVSVTEMQSEGGAAGAVHGALQAGALTTTFTASQGLLLMIPDMYKIAGELTPFVMHVAARTLATHALSIFGDHSDVMACRQTGFAMLSSSSVQEAHDLACIAQAATLESRIPFLHFFDGFRTSHEEARVELLSDDDLRVMMRDDHILAHRSRSLSPDRPILRGTTENPDTFFQTWEASNNFYLACPNIVQGVMEHFGTRTGRRYNLFDYYGDKDAERVIVLMGSGVQTAVETVEHMAEQGEKVGVLAVRLYRPFSVPHFFNSLPKTVKAIAVLDRTKEAGSVGEPLYLDVSASLRENRYGHESPFHAIRLIGGRYGLSSKEFTPGMVRAVFEELLKDVPKDPFTIGIEDDVTHLSLPYDAAYDIESKDVTGAVFFGLGADGTVGANKNSIKIFVEETNNYAQGYYVYDSKKSGAVTISHLRFSPVPIRSSYLLRQAGFVACHQFSFLEKYDVLRYALPDGVFLLNSPYGKDEVWEHLPGEVQSGIIDKNLRFYVIDAGRVAREAGMGNRINTIMQTCFFAISGVLPREEAIGKIKDSIKLTYGKKGEEVVNRNCAAVDTTLDNLYEVSVADRSVSGSPRPPIVPASAPDLIKKVIAPMMLGDGDRLPVSAFPPDGTWPTATTQWEKRNIAYEVPVWDPKVCIQCMKCSMHCPHATIRGKIFDASLLSNAPPTFQSVPLRFKDFGEKQFSIQVAVEDCTGCGLCVVVCPARNKTNPRRKAINMEPQAPLRERERENYSFFLSLPDLNRSTVKKLDVRTSQYLTPLFEYSGACAGCGETPYVRLLTQLYGDRLLIANATGCSSIYGGNLPTCPYTTDREGRGPAWGNSLFEDNAEFGLGLRLAVDSQRSQAERLLRGFEPELGPDFIETLTKPFSETDDEITQQRARVAELKQRLQFMPGQEARRLEMLADYLVPKSVWIVGGDGWAYDIGYGGLDHVLSIRRNVNILVLDTGVYSNTGGQASKATPLGAAAKFAARGKDVNKKDLGLMALSHGQVYVASVALGANEGHTLRAFIEAGSYPGPSIIIAYSHCIAQGYDLRFGPQQQKRAVDCGVWPLYRYDPRRLDAGEPPLIVDAEGGKIPVSEYMTNETRFKMVEKLDPAAFRKYAVDSQIIAERRMAVYRHMSQLRLPKASIGGAPMTEKPSETGLQQGKEE